MRYLQQELPAFKTEGATLIALTPEVPDKSLSTKEKNELEFEVLSDLHNQIAREYGIVYNLIPKLAASFQKGFDLHGYNDDESNELPLAATYVIDREGVVRYAFMDAEYRNRAEPAEIIKVLKGLNQNYAPNRRWDLMRSRSELRNMVLISHFSSRAI